ncbi:MAG: BatA domain-containing protein [Candidatus Binatia bacterium]
MEFLNPAALSALFLLPLLLIPYLIKGKPRRLIFSSLLLLKEFAPVSIGRRWGTLRLPPIFFLQLLLLLLLLLALGEPVFSIWPLNIALILDNSASMQTLEGRKSRFKMAQDKAQKVLRGVPARARVALFVTTPGLEQVGEKDLAPSEARAFIAGLHPYDLGDPAGNYGDKLFQLAKDKTYDQIYFLTDHPVRNPGGFIRVVSVGSPKKNIAITAFHLTHSSFVSSPLQARVQLTNFSPEKEEVTLALKGAGKVVSSRAQRLGPRKTVEVTFDGLPRNPYYEAYLQPEDAFALDNHSFAVSPISKEMKLLVISPRPRAFSSLRQIAGLSLEVIAPRTYEQRRGKDHSLEIFHYSAPAALPRNNTLFILPPGANPLVTLGKGLRQPVISAWREPHALTRYVNFALFRPSYARPLKPLSFGETIIQSPEGALALAVEHAGYRYLILGFDPFPYLGQKNLPVSIFTLNLLEWFYQGSGASAMATGKMLPLPENANRGVLLTPRKKRFPLKRESRGFSRTFYQGLYQVIQGQKKKLMAVNFQDVRESDLKHPVFITLKEGAGVSGKRSVLYSFWPYLLLLAICVLILEWFFNPPATQPELNTGDGRVRHGP